MVAAVAGFGDSGAKRPDVKNSILRRLVLAANAGILALASAPAAPADEAVPPYFSNPERAKPLPRTLSPDKFDHPILKRAYAAAGKLREVLVQLPCYCWCNKFAHRSLLDCFATAHGAG